MDKINVNIVFHCKHFCKKKQTNKHYFCFHMDNSVYLTLFYRLVSLYIFFKIPNETTKFWNCGGITLSSKWNLSKGTFFFYKMWNIFVLNVINRYVNDGILPLIRWMFEKRNDICKANLSIYLPCGFNVFHYGISAFLKCHL